MSYNAFAAKDGNHKESLLKLWRESMNDRRVGSVLERRYAWLYESNPAGAAYTWMVSHTESNTIIGSASVYPRMTRVGDRMVKAGVLADFVVAEGHRIAGPAVMVQRGIQNASLESGLEFLYGYPNKGAAPIFPRLRFKKLGETTMWVKPLRTADQLAKFINPITARLAGLFADHVLSANDLRLRLPRPRLVGANLQSAPDSSFDPLWVRAMARYPVIGMRDAEYLRWRYTDHTTETYHFFVAEDRTAMRGYVVFTVRDQKAFLVDLFCDGDRRTTEALLLRFCHRMRQEGYKSVCVIYVGNPAFLDSLRALQFVQRPAARNLIAWVPPTQPDAFRDLVYDINNWTMFDGELDI